jgi:hypothetical protein
VRYVSFQQRNESGLLKMMIGGESFGDAAFAHDEE